MTKSVLTFASGIYCAWGLIFVIMFAVIYSHAEHRVGGLVVILVVQQHCFILGWRELHILAGVYKLALHVAVSRSALYRIIVFPHRRTPRSA